MKRKLSWLMTAVLGIAVINTAVRGDTPGNEGGVSDRGVRPLFNGYAATRQVAQVSLNADEEDKDDKSSIKELIADLQAQIDALEARVAANEGDIATNAAGISTNAAGVATNAVGIEENASNLAFIHP